MWEIKRNLTEMNFFEDKNERMKMWEKQALLGKELWRSSRKKKFKVLLMNLEIKKIIGDFLD